MQSMQINSDRIFNNIKANLKEELEGQKLGWKYMVPYLIGGVLCLGLSEQCLLNPSEKVAWTVSKILTGGQWAFTIGGVFHLFHKLKQRDDERLCRKIEYIKIPKQEFDAIQSEILFLRQQLDQSNLKKV